VSSWSSEMQKLLQNVFMTNEIFVDSGSGFSRTLTLQDTPTIQKQPVFPPFSYICCVIFSHDFFAPDRRFYFLFFQDCNALMMCGCVWAQVAVWVCCICV